MTLTTTNKPTETEERALALRAQSQALTKFNPEQIRIESQALRALMPKQYGARDRNDNFIVTDEQLASLMIASFASGLSPARGEIYFLPGSGVMVATKVIVSDAVAEQERLGNYLNIVWERVTPEMCELAGSVYARFAGAINPGDVARACRIKSSRARREHIALCVQYSNLGRSYGYSGSALEDWVKAQAGTEPEIVALGIVRSTENFGGDVKYTREQRAEKRATKAALNAGGYAAMDRRNYGGVRLADEVEASGETLEGDFTITSSEPIGSSMSGMSEPEPETLAPVSDGDRLRLSILIDAYPDAKKEWKREGKSAEGKEKFKKAIIQMLELVNIQLSARGMEAVSAKSTDEAMPIIARVLEIMRDYDERAPHTEPEPQA